MGKNLAATLTAQAIEQLYAMKLNGMAEAFKKQLQQPDMAELPFRRPICLAWIGSGPEREILLDSA